MISSEVERTLVKSPPELWTELSDPASLARHLGELGEIRITRVEPEHEVEWEAEGISGSVLLKPSGWGTKVTLSVTRETVTETEPAADPAPELDSTPEPEPEPVAETVAEPEPVAEALAEPVIEVEPQPELRRSFFARLFSRRRRETTPQPATTPANDEQPIVATAEVLAAIAQALAPERFATIDPLPRPREVESAPPEQTQDLAAELKAAEEIAAEEVTAVLTSVLDRLGAAHHRPFSRA